MTALAVKGLSLVTQGSTEAGMSLLDEACTAALHEEIEDRCCAPRSCAP